MQVKCQNKAWVLNGIRITFNGFLFIIILKHRYGMVHADEARSECHYISYLQLNLLRPGGKDLLSGQLINLAERVDFELQAREIQYTQQNCDTGDGIEP